MYKFVVILLALASRPALASDCPDVSHFTEFHEGQTKLKTVYRIEDCKQVVEEKYVNDTLTEGSRKVYPIDGVLRETLHEGERRDHKIYQWDTENKTLVYIWRITRTNSDGELRSYTYYTNTFARIDDKVLETRNRQNAVMTRYGWETEESRRFFSYDALKLP